MSASEPAPHERSIDPTTSLDSVAAWARGAAVELLGAAAGPITHDVGRVARTLTADALARGRPPQTIRVTATGTGVDITVAGGRTVAQRTLSQDDPAFIEIRRLCENVRTRVGPGGFGSVVIATVALPRRRPPRLVAWPRLRRGGR